MWGSRAGVRAPGAVLEDASGSRPGGRVHTNLEGRACSDECPLSSENEAEHPDDFSTHADEKPTGVSGASSLWRRTQRTLRQRETLRLGEADHALQDERTVERRRKRTNSERGHRDREPDTSMLGRRVRKRELAERGTLRRVTACRGAKNAAMREGRNDTNPRVGAGDGNIAQPPGR